MTTEYNVSVHSACEAETPEDAVRQMVAWLDDLGARTAGYRVADPETDGSWFIDAERLLDPEDATCRHCGRPIVSSARSDENGIWIDPEATGDDGVWRETCDAHDTLVADHEPKLVQPARPGEMSDALLSDGRLPNRNEYATPSEVVAVRLYHEEGIGSGGDWAIDGIDDVTRYTEAVWTFDTRDEAVAAIPEFRRNHGIPDAAITQEGP